MHVWKYRKGDVRKIVPWLKMLIGSAFLLFWFIIFSPVTQTEIEMARALMATWGGEMLLLGSNKKDVSWLSWSGSCCEANQSITFLWSRTCAIRCWLAPGVKFGSGPGRLRFTERQQTGLEDSSHWINKIVLILFECSKNYRHLESQWGSREFIEVKHQGFFNEVHRK